MLARSRREWVPSALFLRHGDARCDPEKPQAGPFEAGFCCQQASPQSLSLQNTLALRITSWYPKFRADHSVYSMLRAGLVTRHMYNRGGNPVAPHLSGLS